MARRNRRGRFAPYVIGAGLAGLTLLMAVFGLYAAWLREPLTGFWVTGLLTGPLAALLLWYGHSQAEPTRRETFIGVMLLWLIIPLFGAIPFAYGGMTPVSAVFESMSGYTATGATALRDFESFPRSLFLYRAITQWFGGIGIIVLFVAVFPQLAIAGRQMFFAELPGPTEERLTPRLRHTAGAVLRVYLVFTIAATVAYAVAGMPLFDALAHALTTVSAAGFSPHALSLQGYALPAAEWVAIFFMTLAGVGFLLNYQLLTGNPRALWHSPELRVYLLLILVASALLFLALQELYSPGEALRHSLFQAISILTTTGYSSADFAAWPIPAQAVLVMLMFIGGSDGSAAGGIKIIRWMIIGSNTVRELRCALHPRAIAPLRIGGRLIPEEALKAVAAFITLYVGLVALLAMILAWFGADFVTAFSAAAATVGNVGPGLGLVGPVAHYSDLHSISLAALTFGMYAGRLEIIPIFVLLDPQFWRLPRRSR